MARILFYPVGNNVQDLMSGQDSNTKDNSVSQQDNPTTEVGGQVKP